MLDWFGPAKLVHSSVRSIRGLADDDVVLVLKHDSGVDSYLSASAIVGAAGPRIRMMGDKGALIIHDLDKQEPLLRSGMRPEVGGWKLDTTTTAQIHRGEEILDYSAVPGDYTQFYLQVAEAIRGNGVMPVSIQDALDVAFIVDQAREISIR